MSLSQTLTWHKFCDKWQIRSFGSLHEGAPDKSACFVEVCEDCEGAEIDTFPASTCQRQSFPEIPNHQLISADDFTMGFTIGKEYPFMISVKPECSKGDFILGERTIQAMKSAFWPRDTRVQISSVFLR